MKRFPSFLALSLVLAGLGHGSDYVSGEVLVKFRSDSRLAETAVPLALQASVLQRIGGIDVLRLKLRRGQSVGSGLQQLRAHPAVEFAEPNYLVRAFETPNDPRFPTQWNLAKIRCSVGWDLSTGSSDVIIAVLDTGVDLDHPDLVNKLVPGYNIVRNNDNPADDNGHGTHTAGIAAAATNNGIGIAGVGYHSRIMPIKVLNSNGGGSISDVAAGINYAATHGANVISMSLGGTSGSSTMLAAVNAAWNSGVLLVGASGNSGVSQQTFPAGYDNVIAVGSTDVNDLRAPSSNFGFWVDVAAPGESITSTWHDGGYRIMSGTSMAAPHVAGLGALLWAHLGLGATVSEVRARIEQNVFPLGSWVSKGRIDVDRALRNAGSAIPVRRAVEPSSLEVDTGQVVGGTVSSLSDSDDLRLDLMGAPASGGRRARFRVSGSPEWGPERMAIEVSVEANSSPGGSVRCWLWDWNQGAYVFIGALNYGGSDRVQTFRMSDTGPFVGLSGEIRARVERHEPRNRPFRFKVDQIEIASVSLD